MKPTESNHKFSLGIDISKADYHVAIQCCESGDFLSRSKFSNTAESHFTPDQQPEKRSYTLRQQLRKHH